MTTITIPGLSRTTKRPGLRGSVTLGAGRLSSEDQPRRLLCVGNKISAGSLTVDAQYVRVTSEDEVDTYAGAGSELAQMAYKALLQTDVEVWIAACAEGGSAVAGTATVTFTGTSTASGTLKFRIDGKAGELAIASGTSATAAGAALAAKIAEDSRSPVTTGASTGVVTLTSKSKGIRANFHSVYIDQSEMPAGLSAAVAGGSALPSIGRQTGCRFVNGSVVDDITNLVSVLKTFKFDTICAAHIDATNAGAWKSHVATLAAVGSQIFTPYVLAQTGTYSTAQAISATTLNDAYGQIVHIEDSENHPGEVAGAMGALRQHMDNIHPNQTFAGEELLGLAPLVSPGSIPTDTEIETSLTNGITPCITDGDVVRVVESITTHCLITGGSAADFRTYRTGEARVPFRIFEDIDLLWESEFKPANPWLRDNLPEGKTADQGVATPAMWANAINKLLKDREGDHWIVNVGLGNNTTNVVYDGTFKGFLAQINVEVHPVHSKTGLNVRQYAS